MMSAVSDYEDAKKALENPTIKSYTYKGKRYTLTKLRDELLPSLKVAADKERAEVQAGETAVRMSGQAIQDAQSALTRANKALEGARKKFARGDLDETGLKPFEDAVVIAQRTVDSLSGKTPTPVVAPLTVSAQNIPGPTVRAGVGARPTTPAKPDDTETVTEQPVETPPVTATTATTTTGKKPKKGAKPVAVQGIGPMNLPQDVRDEFKQMFPQYAASLDGGTKEQQFVDFFGSDLIAIWVKQLNPDTAYDLSDATEKAAFARDVENTAYGQRTSQNEQNFDFNPSGQAELIRIKKNEITKQYGDLQLNMQQLDAVAREAARKGYTGDDLQFAVYNFAYQQVPSTTVAGTEIADRLRNAGRAYGYTPSDAEIKAALTNTPYNGMMVTEDTIREKAQRAAKGQYKHLSEQIDAGLSLDDIFYNYKSYASKVLQVDPSQIDFVNDPKWAEAFGNDKTGQLSLNDWLFKLKSDDRYGYQFTDAARQQATNLVMAMEKAFGFRR
jgi:hypothetical protein